MNLYKICLYVYGLNILSVTLHELAHCLVACFTFGEIEELSIGNLIYPVTIKKLRISPIIFSGYVSVEQEKVLAASDIEICAFYLSGPLVTILLGVIFYFVLGTLLFRIMGLYNILAGCFFLLPLPNTDMNNLIRVLRYKHIHQG